MKRRVFLCGFGLFIVMLAVPLWASVEVCTVDYWSRQFTGVNLPATDGMVTFSENQPVIGKVVNAETLMSHGLEGVKKGDEIEATWLGGDKFKLMHVPSGKSVDIAFPKDKIKLKK